MQLINIVSWFIGLVILVIGGLVLDLPYTHSYVMLFWALPAGSTVGRAFAER